MALLQPAVAAIAPMDMSSVTSAILARRAASCVSSASQIPQQAGNAPQLWTMDAFSAAGVRRGRAGATTAQKRTCRSRRDEQQGLQRGHL